MDDIKMSEFGEMAILEYMVNEYQGKKVNQKNLNAYLVKNDLMIISQFVKNLSRHSLGE